ncbi:MAG: hypothetical protein A3C27_00810 [Candidatus Levybacteria bacterium RIFCSPHIGHO2_02_FULL_39_36]|nr:MAG: hypothetical protein UT56_C0001G0022 [Candidatus Levybacteria bacterium GW2011_GWB1_39_7]OGH25337.1 MAG: hypothetical protein A3E68_01470 [Candidatus Levybacteria bacterium RIFCSPHIGHO2_12_FULL_39_39]OGH28914.1 MAG: hypothetical protein A3C27_00810 [Candidatus Levybacteria bacterium RIFCSPHIGHO2_02_FULL_39_36]OGH45211.1 MAG: hypothetical protein A3H82_01905 [Candidatus Levybacteria bacterium RIFCSPLOWO2_02_FULL_39_26]OGH47040.1 MAG: hypothetical protein A3G66_01660 [Candidatus Levybacte
MVPSGIFKLDLSKRQKFVLGVTLLSAGIFLSEFLSGVAVIFVALILSILTVIFLFLALKEDIKDTFFYPIFILPFLFTLSFSLFYPLIPARFLTKIALTSLYAFGVYSLFLTQNILAVSAIRTINLLRSARIVSFVLTIIVLFLLTNIVFSLRLPIYISPILVFTIAFLLNFQSLWFYSLSSESIREIFFFSGLISLCLAELSLILNMWPINASIYSIFLTGIFYAYSGLTHAWLEKRLFRGVLWEYVWVGFLAILILVFFSNWGL